MLKNEVKFLINSIFIISRFCESFILERVNDINFKQIWQVTNVTIYEFKIWAARVASVSLNFTFHIDNSVFIVVLIKGARLINVSLIANRARSKRREEIREFFRTQES